MKVVFAWFRDSLLKKSFENPKAFEKNLFKIFLPLIVGVPIFTFLNNLPDTGNHKENISLNREQYNDSVIPIPSKIKIDESLRNLGEFLYSTNLLSENEKYSCNTCHSLEDGGTNRTLIPNPPTIFNSGILMYQSGMNRGFSYKVTFGSSVHFPVEMGSISSNISKLNILIKSQPALKSFSGKIDEDLIINSINEFIISLNTPNSRFDKYLKGDKAILNKEEIEGYVLFREYGCTTCHQGVLLGGNVSQIINQNGESLNISTPTIKVPGLRNVAVTSPYLSDGSIKSLPEAVSSMVETHVGLKISDEEINKIVKFLETLTGEYKGKILK